MVNAQGASDQAWLDSYDTNTKTYIVIDYKDLQNNHYTEALVRHYGEWTSVAIPTAIDLSHESITELKDVSSFASKIGYALVASSSTATSWGGVPVFLKPQSGANTLTVAELLTIVSAPTAAATFTESDYSTFVTTEAGEVLKIDLKAIQSDIESVESSVATNATNIQANTDELGRRLALTSDDDHWNANSKKIGNLTNGSHAQDAVTKQQLDTAIDEVSDFETYKSFSDFETALTARGGSLTFKNLGDEGLSDDEIRGYNMSEVFSKMLDREQFFWSFSSDYENIFPITFGKSFFERLNSSRCSATLSTKSGCKFFDFSEDPSSTSGVWKQRAQYETDNNIHLGLNKILYDSRADSATSGTAGLFFEFSKVNVIANDSFKVSVGSVNDFKVDSSKVEFGNRELSNATNIKINNNSNTSLYSANNSNQSISFPNGGALSLSVESGKAIDFKFAGSVVQSLQSDRLDMGSTQVKNMADGVLTNDGATVGQATVLIDNEFTSALNPTDIGEGQLLDELVTSQNGGYGKNKQISYQPIQTGLNNNLDTDYSLIWGIHERIGSNVLFVHFHEDFLEQKIDSGDLTGITNLGILITEGEAALSRSQRNAPSNGCWDYAARAIPLTDPNSTTNTSFLDENGNATDEAGAFRATYSTGRFRNVGSTLFQRGYVNVVNDATPATFSRDDTSPWFVALATAGGGTFNTRKQFAIYQTDCSNSNSIQVYYETTADIFGANIESNSDRILELEERVSELEEDTIELSADANNVVESIAVSSSNSGSFSMLDNTTKTFELPMRQDVGGVDVNFTISNVSGNQREYKRLHVFNGGSGYEVIEGLSYGHEFTQLAISYDTSNSNTSGNATLSIIGTGSGATLEFTYKTSLSFH